MESRIHYHLGLSYVNSQNFSAALQHFADDLKAAFHNLNGKYFILFLRNHWQLTNSIWGKKRLKLA